jgi:hypothetical protein
MLPCSPSAGQACRQGPGGADGAPAGLLGDRGGILPARPNRRLLCGSHTGVISGRLWWAEQNAADAALQPQRWPGVPLGPRRCRRCPGWPPRRPVPGPWRLLVGPVHHGGPPTVPGLQKTLTYGRWHLVAVGDSWLCLRFRIHTRVFMPASHSQCPWPSWVGAPASPRRR